MNNRAPLRRFSLAARLLAGVVLCQLLMAGGLAWIAVRQTSRQLRAAFDTGLRGRALGVVALVRYPEKGPGLLFDTTMVPPPDDPAHPDLYLVRSAQGVWIAGNFPAGVTPPASGTWEFRFDGAPYRGLALPRVPILDTEEDISGPPQLLAAAYAQPLTAMNALVATEVETVVGVGLLALLLAALAAAWTIRRQLHPLRDLAAQAARISPGNWSFEPGPPSAAPVELAPLIEALELMLGRLRDSFQRQREFLADAAHELKTPVAILKSSLQAALQRPRPAEAYREAAEASLQDVERLEELLQRMLRLARAEQGAQSGPRASFPLAAVAAAIQAALARLQPLARAAQIELVMEGLPAPAAGLPAIDDAEAMENLELVWVNLVENAVQHSPAGERVTVRLHCEPGAAVVSVEDHGAGIPAAELPFIFERFHRGQEARLTHRHGFGLGLAIARAIVDAYAGTITVSSRPGDGATLTVHLPLSRG